MVLTLIKSTKLNQQLATSNENQNVIVAPQQVDTPIDSTGRIGSDGSVLLLEVGRLEATGKSLNELRSEVRNILIRNGVSPRFQLEIVEFELQKAYLTVNTESSVVKLNDQITTLKDILTAANVGFNPGVITRIRLNRNGKEFSSCCVTSTMKRPLNINIQSGDHIFIEDSSAVIVTTKSTIDNQGYLVFETVGKVKAAGRTLNELKNNFENLMQPVPDSQNAFKYKSQTLPHKEHYLHPDGKSGVLIPITDKPKKLSEVLT